MSVISISCRKILDLQILYFLKVLTLWLLWFRGVSSIKNVFKAEIRHHRTLCTYLHQTFKWFGVTGVNWNWICTGWFFYSLQIEFKFHELKENVRKNGLFSVAIWVYAGNSMNLIAKVIFFVFGSSTYTQKILLNEDPKNIFENIYTFIAMEAKLTQLAQVGIEVTYLSIRYKKYI